MAADAVYSAITDWLKQAGNVAPLVNPTTNVLPPFRFPNEEMDLPETPVEFIDVAFTGMLFGQETIGASRQQDNRWDQTGKLWLTVMVPAGTGLVRGLQLAQAAANLFRGLLLLNDSIDFGDAFIGQGAPNDEEGGNWFAIPVRIEWRQMEA